jgi:hypothetical protein
LELDLGARSIFGEDIKPRVDTPNNSKILNAIIVNKKLDFINFATWS